VTQTLNLYDGRWLDPPERVQPWPPLAVAGGALALALGVAWWNHVQQARLTEQLAATMAERSRLEGQAAPGGERAAAIQALAAAAQQRESRLQQWRGIGAHPTAGQGAAGAPASQWFLALAAVSHDGTWLTRVQSDVSGGFRLEGRAQDGVALSSYLERWRSEPLLAGVAFQTLEMRRAAGETGAPGAPTPMLTPAPASAGNPDELVFVLSNLATGATPGTGAGRGDTAAPPAGQSGTGMAANPGAGL
jgi:hypothetical protein